MSETNTCPHCAGAIPDDTVKAWYKRIRYGTQKKLRPCAGTRENGDPCGRMLGARERLHPCPGCGHNNWKEGNEDDERNNAG